MHVQNYRTQELGKAVQEVVTAVCEQSLKEKSKN